MAKPNWVTVNPSSGKGSAVFRIIFAKNTSTSPRSGVVTVKSLSGLTHEIQVTQAGNVTKGKITFNYTGEKIPQKYVGQILYAAESENSPEFYVNYGQIESITDGTVVVNLDNLDESNLKYILSMFKSNMLGLTDLYFGVSDSDDPTIDWFPFLLVNDPEDKNDVSELAAAKIQSAFNGADEDFLSESLIVPVEDIVCSWGISTMNLMNATTTRNVLNDASVSAVTFKVYADIYPNGSRLPILPMSNIEVGHFTLSVKAGDSLTKVVVISKNSTNSQKFTWYKGWSSVALCRFTIKCDFNQVNATLSKNLIVNGKTFTKHESAGEIYFENPEGIPLQKLSNQTLVISSNTPTLSFNTFA